MHKNTLMVVSFLAVIAALLVGFNLGRRMQSASPVSDEAKITPITSPTPTLAYLSGNTCGITFQYPNTLTPIESTASGTILASRDKPDDSIVIICQHDIPRTPLTDDRMERMTIRAATGSATISATLYHDASAKDGSPIDKLIFTHPKTGLDVFVGGIGPIYEHLLKTLKLL